MKRVLYSPGFGAGIADQWNSIDTSDPKLLELYDRRASREEVEEVFPDGYWSGWNSVECAEVPEGSYYIIHEYDGNESIQIVNSLEEAGFTRA